MSVISNNSDHLDITHFISRMYASNPWRIQLSHITGILPTNELIIIRQEPPNLLGAVGHDVLKPVVSTAEHLN